MDPLTVEDPRVIGGFTLQARLGAGGMGRVYLAFSPAGRAVAVKVIHPHLAREPEFAARFRREVAAAQAVNTVYAAPAVAAGPDDDPPWLATAFIPAPSLQDVVAAGGPLPEEAVWKLTAGLAEALRAIHAGGLVHRDLKPSNVLLAADGPRVIDFGIARVIDGTRLTSTGSLLGTPSFMSPEQARGDRVDPPSDVFSLGGVAYFAATGHTPFGGGIPATLLYRIVFTEPDLDGLPHRLRSLIAACLDKNPATRPRPAQLTSALPSDNSFAGGTAFWPAPVARFIHDYQARLDPGGAQPWQAPSAPIPPVPPATSVADSPPREHRAGGGRHAEPAIAGMGRRRALATLAGMATAGLGVAGWKLAGRTTGSGTGNLTAGKSSGPVAPGTRIWRFKSNSTVGAVAVAGTVVYAGTNGNTVFAIDAATGTEIWRRASTSQTNGPLTVAAGTVIVAGDTSLYAIAADGGAPRWHVTTDASSALTAAGDVVYAGIAPKSDTTGGVTAFAAKSGELLWTYQFGPVADIAGGLAVAGGVVYVTTTNGEIFTLSAADGRGAKRISGPFGKFGAGTVAVVDGVMYAGGGNDNGAVFAVDTADGKSRWRQELGRSSFPAYLAAGNGVLFAGVLRNAQSPGADAGGLYALNATTGHQLWSEPVAGGVNLSPVVAGDTVYTGSSDGVLDAWQASTGNKVWSYPAAGAIGSNVAKVGSRLYFGAGDYVYAVAG